MVLEDVSPRTALVVGLLALVPVSWYGIGSSPSAGVVAGVNVLIVLIALYLAFGPIADRGSTHGHGTDGAS